MDFCLITARQHSHAPTHSNIPSHPRAVTAVRALAGRKLPQPVERAPAVGWPPHLRLGHGGSAPAVLLHIGAVDWRCEVYVNSRWVGSHSGGFDAFSFDITAALGPAVVAVPGANKAERPEVEAAELLVMVFDPSNHGAQPFGKQRRSAGRGGGASII